MTAALRWRLAVTVRSMRLVPPLLGLCAYLGIFLTQRNQAWPSIVAVDVMFAFALALFALVATQTHSVTAVGRLKTWRLLLCFWPLQRATHTPTRMFIHMAMVLMRVRI